MNREVVHGRSQEFPSKESLIHDGSMYCVYSQCDVIERVCPLEFLHSCFMDGGQNGTNPLARPIPQR